MTTSQLVIASCLAILGIAHSVLGEAGILRPLFRSEWQTAMPRWAMEKILRFGWHLTSIAWFALAAIILDGDAFVVVAIMSLGSAALVFVMLRGHLAWPLFLLAGLASLYKSDALGSALLETAAIITAGLLLIAAAVHVYWATGGTWLIDRAAPTAIEGKPFRPGTVATLAVAVALSIFAGLILLAAFERGPDPFRWLVVAGTAVLVVRAIGDNRVAGFTKKVHNTAFGKADDRYFTPLIVFLALGATASLLA